MTLSILAFDPRAEVVGAAVTSCVLAAGRRILHVRAGVGAASVQASSEITWGDDILDALAAGGTPWQAIAPFAKDDTQLATIGFTGALAAHTGAACESHAGHATGEHVTAQVNTAALADAADLMLQAFEATSGSHLAERLIAALAASGGDARGKQSACVIVAGTGPLTGYAHEPHVDLRVDDHREPVTELARLLALHRAHCAMREAFAAGAERDVDLLGVIAPLAAQHPDDPHLQRALDTARRHCATDGLTNQP